MSVESLYRDQIRKMPIVERLRLIFDGIKTTMYYRDHQPPHFHALAGDEEAEVGIDPIMILEGKLSRSVRAKVFEWAAIHQVELRANWELARGQRSLLPIEPLD